MTPADRLAAWRNRAAELERFAPAATEAFRMAADELEQDLRDAADEELTMAEASRVSGLSDRRLRELVASGELPNAGRKGAPRIRRADLPRKRAGAIPASTYDPAADAARLLARAR